ncbi:hypothetical protein [Desulfosoma caldarium]|uniref:Uncharacterized protein n=1 Tax=Desulfosoma caldarium TaxID=610254 RepID=A0A3N1UIA5_9BACT|nr:hypothetical protein [Desulfosoma caldarium]ROQ90992.1 hypothetical protein EDC27_2267 [Desulfosoma caldarium]
MKPSRTENPLELCCLPASAQETLRHYDHRVASLLLQARDAVDPAMWEKQRRLPSAFLTHLEKAFLVYDQSLRFAQSQLHRAGWSITCAPGCSHCCTQLPSGLTGVEILYLSHGALRAGVLDRMFRRCLERLELWEEIRRWNAQDLAQACLERSLAQRLHRYNALKVPCPFLEAGLCSLYRYRPLACRIHFSLSPPHWCRPDHFQNAHAIRFNLEPSHQVMDALERLDQVLQLNLSDLLVCGFVEWVVNVMAFRPIAWTENPH